MTHPSCVSVWNQDFVTTLFPTNHGNSQQRLRSAIEAQPNVCGQPNMSPRTSAFLAKSSVALPKANDLVPCLVKLGQLKNTIKYLETETLQSVEKWDVPGELIVGMARFQVTP